MNTIRVLSIFFVLLVFQSCTDSRWQVDTSSVNYSGEIMRLDRELFSNRPINPEYLQSLTPKYGEFLNNYLTDIMRVGKVNNPMTAELFNRFLTDPTWIGLQEIIEKHYPDLDSESARLENAFKHYAILFKQKQLPQIVAYNSGFNVGIYPTHDYLGIGLEWYSGGDLDILDRLPPDLFPQYKRDKMKPEYLVPNALKGWLFVEHQSVKNGESLLNRMVFAGKILFTAHILLEELPDGELINYSDDQLQWCQNQEFQVWNYLLENDLLFSEEAREVEKMMNDGPFTPGMPPESPGGVGNWIGYQMVKAFMERNDKITLPELLHLKNDKVFLKAYKP